MTGVVVIILAMRRAKPQCQSTEREKVPQSMDLFTLSSPGGLPTFPLTIKCQTLGEGFQASCQSSDANALKLAHL